VRSQRSGTHAVTAAAAVARAWYRDLRGVLEVLAERRPLRLAVLLGVNALALPYGNLVHDAELYAFLVLNRVSHGAFSTDLFLRFGSQDQYTPFSPVAAHVAAVIGIEWAFFLFFLIFNTSLVVASERLVAMLIEEPVLRTLTQLFVVMSPLPYGGFGVLHVQENFFTPRIIACALGLFGLGAILRQRYMAAFILSAVATLAHPIMGFGVVMLLVIVVGMECFPRRIAVAGFGVGLTIGLIGLTYLPFGRALFGTMDPEWLTIVRQGSAYALLGGWTVSDWARTIVALGLVSGAAFVLRHECPLRARVLLAATLTAIAGLGATAAADRLLYRLLIQAQPYRAIWMIHVLQVPAAAFLAWRAWRSGGWGRVGAVMLLGLVSLMDFAVPEIVLPLTAVPILLILQKRLGIPRSPETLAAVIAVSLIVGLTAWGLLRLQFAMTRARDLLAVMDVILYVRTLTGCVPRFVWLVLVLAVLSRLTRQARAIGAVTVLAITIAGATHVTAFGISQVPSLRARLRPDGADVDFVRRFLRERYASETPPLTVYAGAWGAIGYVWLDLRAQNYLAATVTNFSRETAFETRRRAHIIRAFELERYRGMHGLIAEAVRPLIAYFYAPEQPAPSPTVSDLRRLCRPDEGVDVAVLSQHFDALASADNGRVFIYECERVRAATS
jgi:hypothetical protein